MIGAASRRLAIVLFVAMLGGCRAPAATVETVDAAALVWPDDWQGRWSGALEIEGANGVPPVDFSLTIGEASEDGSRGWELLYAGQAAREYRLVPIDPSSGEWAVDEQSGIVLPARRVGDTLVSAFAVGQQLLVTRQRFLPDRVEHEIIVLKREPEATGLEVASHGVRSRQRATLRRSE